VKYLDYLSLLDGSPAQIAFLSTFQFDPDFFERRILRSETLSKARRIVVFMDAGQWLDLLSRDVSARWINRRYLVVPVRRSTGVFHPKLTLLLRESGSRVLCGSNNLTRSGCSSNLELLNSIEVGPADRNIPSANLARGAFSFFKSAAKNTDEGIRGIVNQWIDETAATFPWLEEPVGEQPQTAARLLHTYDGSLWERLVKQLADHEPREFFIISPFHDGQAELSQRLAAHWPRAKVEMLVQQGYTNLNVKSLKKVKGVRLSELRNSSRRIHAKLLAWRGGRRAGCLVGSANFTTVAFDGRNVEACLLLPDAGDLVDQLFDGSFSKRPLGWDDFEPGDAEETEPVAQTQSPLRVQSAILTSGHQLKVSCSHSLKKAPSELRVTIRTVGEVHPRASIVIPSKTVSTATVDLPDGALVDANGTLLATLVADVGGERIESLPVWVIQEERLTFEPGDGVSSSKAKIEETGEGLPEYLNELGKRDGLQAVVEYLRHMNIRFHDGASDGTRHRRFRVVIRDPFRLDAPPDWLIMPDLEKTDLEAAILDFVERHQDKRLGKHAERGNINGIDNFLDIFRALVRLLSAYYKLHVVKGGRLVSALCRSLELATSGSGVEDEECDGYMSSVQSTLGGDLRILRDVCSETHYWAEVRAALLVAQSVRFDPDDRPRVARPREVLPTLAKAVAACISECGCDEPSADDVRAALASHNVFSDSEIEQLVGELPD